MLFYLDQYHKGANFNQIAEKFLKITEDIVPNWVENVPDPNVTIGKNVILSLLRW